MFYYTMLPAMLYYTALLTKLYYTILLTIPFYCSHTFLHRPSLVIAPDYNTQ